MKIIRNNICYIELEDVRRLKDIPQNIMNQIYSRIYCISFIKFAKIEGTEAVNFFKEKEYILDYDLVSDLTEEEIKFVIENLEKYIKDKKTEISELKSSVMSIKKYLNNKKIYDTSFKRSSIENKKYKKLELLSNN